MALGVPRVLGVPVRAVACVSVFRCSDVACYGVLRPVCGSWFSVFRQKLPRTLCRQNCALWRFMALHVYIYVYCVLARSMPVFVAYGVRWYPAHCLILRGSCFPCIAAGAVAGKNYVTHVWKELCKPTISSLHYVYLWFFWGIFRSGTWNFPKNFSGSVLDPARRCHQREPENVGFLISHTYARGKLKNFSRNLVFLISHIRADASAPDPAAADCQFGEKISICVYDLCKFR